MRQRDIFTFALPETSLEPILGRPKHRIEANTPQPAQPPAPQRRAFWGSASLSGGVRIGVHKASLVLLQMWLCPIYPFVREESKCAIDLRMVCGRAPATLVC